MSNTTKVSILVICSLLLGAFLLSRPTFVVSSDAQTTSSKPAKKDPQEKHEDTKHTLSTGGQKNLQEAFALLKSNPNSASTLDIISEIYRKESFFDSSAYYLEKSISVSPSAEKILKSADTYFQAANLAIDPVKAESFFIKARGIYEDILKKEPQNLYAKTQLGSTYVRSENPMKGIGIIKEVLDTNPNYVMAIYTLGTMAIQSGQWDKAVQRFEKVLVLEPRNINAKMGLAFSLTELGKKEESKKLYNELLNDDLDPILKEEIRKTLKSLE
ncbi:MAG: tetratricopeptide repeat protein [Leadbetterella sp.]